MEICYQKSKLVIYSEACPETRLRALASARETKMNTACCRLAIRYAEEAPAAMPTWFSERYMKFLKDMAREKGQAFVQKTDRQKLLLYSEYEKGKHPFINFAARGYDESEITDKKTKEPKKGPWRKQKHVRLSGLVAIDIDHVDDARAIFERWQKEVDMQALRIYFVYITPRGGLRVIFRCEASRGNLIDNQLWMCERLGVEPDASCKDASRGSFLTSDENFLYDNLKQMYEDEPDEAFIAKYEPEYRAGNSSATQSGAVADKSAGSGPAPVEAVAGQAVQVKWRGYDVQAIIDARYAEKLPCEADKNRHAESLKLASDLLIMLDGDKQLVQGIVERQSWVKEIIAERDENVGQTVESAASRMAEKEKKYASSLPGKAMLEAVRKCCGRSYQEILKGSQEAGDAEQSIFLRLEAWGSEIEKLFDVYPCLREICRGLQMGAYPAALFTGAAFLGTDMTRCWYHHYHRPEDMRRLNYCVYIIGDPGSGKSFAGRLMKLLAAPIIASDKLSNDAINRYKEELKARQTSSKEQKKEPLKQPDVIVRCHGPRTANGVFIEDMNKAVDFVGDQELHLHMLTFDAELDSNMSASKGGQWIDKSTMELKAFHNEEDSQQYKNVDSVTGPFDVFWNYIYTGTPVALHKKVTLNNFGSGLATRLACIPFPPAEEMMALRKYSQADQQGDTLLKTWAYRLDRVAGELPLWPLVEHTWHWTDSKMDRAAFNNDKADEMLLKRCAYYGICISAPFIDMRHWGEREQTGTYTIDDTDLALCDLVLDIHYRTQHFYYGELARNYFDEQQKDATLFRRRTTRYELCFQQLPTEFTTEQFAQTFNFANSRSAAKALNRLLEDKAVERTKRGEYRKRVQSIG